MKVFEAHISYKTSDFLNDALKKTALFEIANQEIYEVSGIVDFFNDDKEFQEFKNTISSKQNIVGEPDRAEYGDFQTNMDLANKATIYLASKCISPEIVIEPTCGKGNFIIASLSEFLNLKHIIGIEIYKPYVWETKFNIINFFLENPGISKPDISIKHCNVFVFDFKQISEKYPTQNILIIGNPPWVTNSKLGSLNSANLPTKTNFKDHKGLDAMTGKGNFDIAEYITLTMLDTFHKMNGNLFFLVKNSVIKNIVYDQYKNKYRISDIEKLTIDSKMEFNVSVEASFVYCKLNSTPTFESKEFDFYKNQITYLKFGWIKDKFVSNIATYIYSKDIDGECPFVWRQGLKHDCAMVMELESVNGHYLNGLNEKVKLEEALVYGILKSSDLKNTVISRTRKYTIVTQKNIGQDTKYIKSKFPMTYQYLLGHLSNFKARKSSIYNNKPLFSIFGIGDYSFKPYKVAISGLYKTFHFTLILPQDNKPVMLDDTCYLIGFDKIEFAVYALMLLNSENTRQFLESITFADAKRTFTKDVLMRIDLLALAKSRGHIDLQMELTKLNKKYGLDLTLNLWDNFVNEMMPINSGQMAMFA